MLDLAASVIGYLIITIFVVIACMMGTAVVISWVSELNSKHWDFNFIGKRRKRIKL